MKKRIAIPNIYVNWEVGTCLLLIIIFIIFIIIIMNIMKISFFTAWKVSVGRRIPANFQPFNFIGYFIPFH
jgi:hypothetical protein